jgi:fumarate hydratase class II
MTRRRPSPTTPTGLRALRESAMDSGAITGEDFDRIVNPAIMVGPF